MTDLFNQLLVFVDISIGLYALKQVISLGKRVDQQHLDHVVIDERVRMLRLDVNRIDTHLERINYVVIDEETLEAMEDEADEVEDLLSRKNHN